MRFKVWFFIVATLLFLCNQKLVILIMLRTGESTIRSFMSRVVILWFLVTWKMFSFCAISFEVLVAHFYGKCIHLLSILLGCLVTLYDASCVLFITGLMFSLSLCILISALHLRAVGFIFVGCLFVRLSISISHCWFVYWIYFQRLQQDFHFDVLSDFLVWKYWLCFLEWFCLL